MPATGRRITSGTSTRRSPRRSASRPEAIAAIRDGRRPTGLPEDQETAYDFTAELLQNKRVSDATFARAEKLFGKPGVVDLTAVSGYYTFLAMELNVARYPLPKDGTPLPRLPE